MCQDRLPHHPSPACRLLLGVNFPFLLGRLQLWPDQRSCHQPHAKIPIHTLENITWVSNKKIYISIDGCVVYISYMYAHEQLLSHFHSSSRHQRVTSTAYKSKQRMLRKKTAGRIGGHQKIVDHIDII